MKILSLLLVFTLFSLKSDGTHLISRAVGTSSLDQTLDPGAAGEDVVDACIQLVNIYLSDFINDLNLLKRIALVESNFGLNQTVIQTNTSGGIWQISSLIYETIKADASLPVVTANGFNLSSSNFSTPLYSAYAARLYIESKFNGLNIPGTIEEQAQWWSNYYHPGADPAVFIERVQEFENANQCIVSKLDLWFVIDGSGSIGTTNFEKSLNFVNQTTAEFFISPDYVRTGLMIYSSDTYTISYLNQHLSNGNFSNAVLSTSYPGGGTRTGKAISEVYNNGFNLTNGMRPLTEGVPRVLVVLTDGHSFDNVTGPSNDVKGDGITVFAVGVGSGFNSDQINEIASEGLAFELTSFEELVTVLKQLITTESCKASAVVPENAVVSVQVAVQQSLYFTLSLPVDGSIELLFTISRAQGSAELYFSTSVKNPNSALHEIKFSIQAGETNLVINAGDLGANNLGQSRRKRSSRHHHHHHEASLRNISSTTIPMYMTLQSTGSQPFNLNLKATSNPARVVTSTTPSASPPVYVHVQSIMLVTFFLILSISLFL